MSSGRDTGDALVDHRLGQAEAILVQPFEEAAHLLARAVEVTVAALDVVPVQRLPERDEGLIQADAQLRGRVRAGEGGERNQGAYIVSLTAQARDLDQHSCLTAGADGFLSKPLSLAQLEQALKPLSLAVQA